LENTFIIGYNEKKPAIVLSAKNIEYACVFKIVMATLKIAV
jgi:hypothetical protein